MNFYPIYRNKKLLPWIKWWLIKGNKVMPKHLSEWINSAEAITLTGVYKGSPLLYLNLNGNTSQTGTPSPEAPVPVNVVKEDNYININDNTYRVDLGGKNIFNKENDLTSLSTANNGGATTEKTIDKITITTGSSANSGFYITRANFISYINNFSSSETYYISMDIKASRNIIVTMGCDTRPNFDITTNTSRIYIATKIASNGFVLYSQSQTANDTIEITNIMISTSQDITYSPYVANPIELCKIGDYQDVIYKENNKWYVDKYIEKVVLNGSETWGGGNSSSGSPSYTYVYTNAIDSYVKSGYYGALSDKLVNLNADMQTTSVVSTDTLGVGATSSYKLRIMVLTSRLGTANINGFKTWLASNNTTVYYVLATSTTSEITDTNLLTQLEAIYNAKLQSGTNTITQTPSDLPFYLNFRYYEKG